MLSNVWEYMDIFSVILANTLGTGGVAYVLRVAKCDLWQQTEKEANKERETERACALSDKLMVLNRQKSSSTVCFGYVRVRERESKMARKSFVLLCAHISKQENEFHERTVCAHTQLQIYYCCISDHDRSYSLSISHTVKLQCSEQNSSFEHGQFTVSISQVYSSTLYRLIHGNSNVYSNFIEIHTHTAREMER